MSSRLEEKQRRKEERQRRERELERAERRGRIVRRALTGAALLAIAGTVTALALIPSGDERADDELTAESEAPFGQHYEGLAERVAEAIPPERQAGGPHVHPKLSVFANGEPVPVPPGIGISPVEPGHAPIHTHEPDGTIHLEGVVDATLGEFFQVWGVPLSPSRLGPYRARGDQTMRMWVGGQPSRAFADLELADGQAIVVSYGPRDFTPPGL